MLQPAASFLGECEAERERKDSSCRLFRTARQRRRRRDGGPGAIQRREALSHACPLLTPPPLLLLLFWKAQKTRASFLSSSRRRMEVELEEQHFSPELTFGSSSCLLPHPFKRSHEGGVVTAQWWHGVRLPIQFEAGGPRSELRVSHSGGTEANSLAAGEREGGREIGRPSERPAHLLPASLSLPHRAAAAKTILQSRRESCPN